MLHSAKRIFQTQVLFIIAAIAVISLVLSRTAIILQPVLAFAYDSRFELVMVIGQVLFQWCFLARETWARRWDYALQVIGVSLLGAILLAPLVLFHAWQPVGLLPGLAYFFAVVGVMFVAHIWRMKVRGLPWWLCVTWVLYRCILLVFIVKWPWS